VKSFELCNEKWTFGSSFFIGNMSFFLSNLNGGFVPYLLSS
jgi:hypothetical protein